jgi:uncharacterized protein (TIGR02271 family)
MTDRQYTFREGMTVFGSDGDKVGKIVAVDPSYIVVEKGFFFPTDYYIPTSAIANMDDDNIYLTVSKDEALNQGWDQPLTSTAGDERFSATTTDAETYAASGAGYQGTAGTAAAFDTTQSTATTDAYGSGAATADYGARGDRQGERPFAHDSHPDATHVHEGDRVRVPVHEEELVASKRPVEAGKVRIEKDIVTEERTMEVPVTEERVRVSQVDVDRDAPIDDATAFQEGVIEVPLRTEEVDLQKRARVTGEVVVEKEATQRTEQVGGAVRREEVRVDDTAVEGSRTDTERGATR